MLVYDKVLFPCDRSLSMGLVLPVHQGSQRHGLHVVRRIDLNVLHHMLGVLVPQGLGPHSLDRLVLSGHLDRVVLQGSASVF